MAPETLRASLAPNLQPDSLSWWPPATGWILLGLGLILVLGTALALYSRHTPWWRWPRVRRQRLAYLAELELVLQQQSDGAQTLNRDISQWLRRLMRDGLGISPNLPPTPFLDALKQRSPEEPSPELENLIYRVYSPHSVGPLLDPLQPELKRLCQTCLHLHSPGPG